MRALPQPPPAPAAPLNEAAWDGRAEPAVFGEGALRRLDALFLHAERLVDGLLPHRFNPLAQSGALAVLTFLIACGSGVLVLIWYSTSVTGAFASVSAMDRSPFTSGLVRSMHRYSADACMLFVVLHAARLFAARRFGGARTLAWVTGIILIAALWFVGWLGYWLVWDERAKEVARLTATMTDVLPVFSDPLSRSFLTDEGVNSLLFFVVFFFHMLVPLGMAVPLWLHLARLSRPRFLTGVWMSAAVAATLLLLSLLVPATAAGPARMTVASASFDYDAWYLLPLLFAGRLGPLGLWALSAGAFTLALLPPFVLQGRRRAAPAVVRTLACNACTLCYEDCPYDAIKLVPRTDGRRFAVQAEVDPDKCLGCGICTGSCDPGAIELPTLGVLATRKRLDGYVTLALGRGDVPLIAFACTSSAGDALKIDPLTGECAQLPGYRVLPVPCAGWVERLTVEREAKRGARILIIGCGPGDRAYREGAKWTAQRLSGVREPALRTDKVLHSAVRFVQLDRTQLGRLQREARSFAEDARGRRAKRRSWLAPLVVAAAGAAVVVPTFTPWAAPARKTELVVSFKHPGQSGQHCRMLSEEEKAALPIHMRQDRVCERERANVRLRILVDGRIKHQKAYEPRGLSADGNSVAIARVAVEPGAHVVEVAIGATPALDAWDSKVSKSVTFAEGQLRVVLFDKVSGFTWYGDTEHRDVR